MKRVLRRLGFTNREDIVQLKGKVACEISACDEILATEFMFSGLMNELEPNEIAALLCSLVHDEHGSDAKIFTMKNERLTKYYEKLRETARRIVKVYQESKINVDEIEYLSNIRADLVETCFAWCNGATFAEICKTTDIYEGSIIRCFRRLDELLKQLIDASKAIGNTVN
jgi:ATP-dependent RNA helicase DOB1